MKLDEKGRLMVHHVEGGVLIERKIACYQKHNNVYTELGSSGIFLKEGQLNQI